MRRAGLTVTLAFALVAPSPAVAKSDEKLPFQPSSPWAIEYADQSCRLIRNFSNGSQDLTLAFERFLPGPDLRLGIAGKVLRIDRWQKTIEFRYGPEGEEQEGPLLRTELADGRESFLIRAAGLLYAFPPPEPPDPAGPPNYSWSIDDELAAARNIVSLSVDDKVDIRLGPMEAPIKALQACIVDLMTDWGIDMDRLLHATRLAEPINRPQSWMSSDDYPKEMLSHGKRGVVGFRLVIDELGRVKQCFVDSDKPGPFEIATCDAVKKKARFTPALDAKGKPMPAIYVNSVRFEL